MIITDPFLARRVLSLMDLTSLNENDTESEIRKLCQHAQTAWGNVSAVCVYGRFVSLAKSLLQTSTVKIATVCNFPSGNSPLIAAKEQIQQAIAAGADEIDLVMPYQNYLAGERTNVIDFVQACKEDCQGKLLKVILETGALIDPAIITSASEDMITAGADFLKTSTGKIAIGATVEAATAMLQVIAKHSHSVGFKASGGIRTLAQAAPYLQAADKSLGSEWISPQHFRFGASALLTEIQMMLA